MLSCDIRRLVAVALVFSTVLVTMPVSAADFSTAKSVIGSVSAVGPVELRGIGMSQEGTLFPGDSIRSGQKGYAKILLGTGSKIELAEKTNVSINRDAQGVKIAMNTGTVGFAAHTPLRIDVLPFEVVASDDATGNVAIMSATTAGVKAVNGRIMVRNLKTSESFVLLKGQERLLGLRDGAHAPSLAEIASNAPVPIPAPGRGPAPQAPTGKTIGGYQLDTGAWIAIIGGGALVGLTVWALIEAKGASSDIDDLQKTVKTLSGTVATNNAALKNVSNATAIANTASQQQATLASISGIAGQAQLALTAAGNLAAAAQAASIASQAAASQGRLNTLQSQIQALQAQLATGGGSSAQLSALLTQEEIERTNTNNLVNALNALLAANRNTPGVPSSTVATVGGPSVASASVPF